MEEPLPSPVNKDDLEEFSSSSDDEEAPTEHLESSSSKDKEEEAPPASTSALEPAAPSQRKQRTIGQKAKLEKFFKEQIEDIDQHIQKLLDKKAEFTVNLGVLKRL